MYNFLRLLNTGLNLLLLQLPELRIQLNKEILVGTYNTPLGEISFTPIGEVVQKHFYVAQIKMEKDGSKGKFTFLK